MYSFLGIADPVSSLTHLGGTFLFLVLGIFLFVHGQGFWNRVWLAVFVVSALFLLSMSGVYHLLPYQSFAREEVLRRLDHAAIFVLIAGTFTAGHGILFTGILRWGVILLLWGGTAAAITLKSVFFHELSYALGLALYLGFGWLGAGSGFLLWRWYGYRFIQPILWGGVAYTLGAVASFISEDAWWPGIFGAHEFFHLAVLAGLGFHWQFAWRIARFHPAVPIHLEASYSQPQLKKPSSPSVK